ncbi:FimD/PapC C-terminal domain-containing protein [Pseudomonas syringae]|uniref:FimD/PapC C-terminal domain-containing protein n=1 Tax=Pseudomonas syringae TaxID=317 RepID=UPI003AF379A1
MVPTLGAVSRVAFTTLSGRAVVLKARHESGRPLPFAAQVFDEHGREVGVVGQASKAFVRGIGEQGRLTVQWSEGAGGRCYIDYRLPPRPVDQRQSRADLVQGRCASTPSKDDSQ